MWGSYKLVANQDSSQKRAAGQVVATNESVTVPHGSFTACVKTGRHQRDQARLERRRLEETRRSLDLISRQWDESRGRLKLFVEAKAGDSGAR